MSDLGIGIMLDCSRGAVMNLPSLKRYIELLAKMGYKTLQLYTEDTYEIKEEPYFGYLRGKYTQAELREIDAFTLEKGIELIPCIQTLGHLDALVRWDRYQPIMDIDNILLADDERTYELIDRMFSALESTFTSRRVHIGMDEVHRVGLGKHLQLHGYENRTAILLRHLKRVTEIADKHGFHPMMWSDMFFALATGGSYRLGAEVSEKVVEEVPQNLDLVYWDYYRFDKDFYANVLRAHGKFRNRIIFAGGLWTWRGFAPHTYTSLKTTSAAMAACREVGCRNIFFTLWGDDGGECSYFTALPLLFYAARAVAGEPDMEQLKVEFHALTGEDFDAMMEMGRANSLDDRNCFSNPSKVWLYQDPFLGIYDRTVPESAPAYYTALAERLEASGAQSHSLKNLFAAQAAFARAVAAKCRLGVAARAAYRAGDKAALMILAEKDFPAAIHAVEAFHTAYQALWFSENKPQGYEFHDIRLGGLAARLKTCEERLKAYAAGKTESLPELEEEILPVHDDGDAIPEEQMWAKIAFPYGRAGH